MKFVDNPKPLCWRRPRTCCDAALSRAPRAISRPGGRTAISSSPSSIDYGDMMIDDLVVVDPDGAVVHAADGRNTVVGDATPPRVLPRVR